MPFMGSIPKNRANLLLFFDIHKYFLLKIKKDTHYCAFFLIFPVPSPSIVRHIVRFYVVLCLRFLSSVYYVQILIGQTEKGSMFASLRYFLTPWYSSTVLVVMVMTSFPSPCERVWGEVFV